MHSWLIEIGGRRILIDTCVGNHKSRPARPKWHQLDTPYLQRLAAAGLRPEQVDMVMCTHLHVDHVGWNTRLDNGRWVPTFPNARYVFSKTDYDYFLALDRDPERGPASHGSFRDSVLPVVEAGLAQMVEGAPRIEEHLAIEPAPGHTPGHVAIKLASQSHRRCSPATRSITRIQVYHPEWNSFACLDQDAARRSRRKLLEDCAGSGALLAPQHFGAPHSAISRRTATDSRHASRDQFTQRPASPAARLQVGAGHGPRDRRTRRRSDRRCRAGRAAPAAR